MSKLCPTKKTPWARGPCFSKTSFFIKGRSEANRKNTVNTSVFGNKSPVLKRTYRHTDRKLNKLFSISATSETHQCFTSFQIAPPNLKKSNKTKEKKIESPRPIFITPVLLYYFTKLIEVN